MPTILVVDVSLSMSRGEEDEEEKEKEGGGGGEGEGQLLRRDLAALGCNIILDHFIQHCKLEFVSLVSRLNHVCDFICILKECSNKCVCKVKFYIFTIMASVYVCVLPLHLIQLHYF